MAPFIMKQLLGESLELEDLRAAEGGGELARQLMDLLKKQNVEEWGIDFTATRSANLFQTRAEDVDLRTDGSNITVTDANKRGYVRDRVNFFFCEGIEEQLNSIESGFLEVGWLSCFSDFSVLPT